MGNFVMHSLNQTLLMSVTYITHRRDEKQIQNSARNHERNRPFGTPGIDEKIILKHILNK
jgi:hypothetical protein